MATTSSKPATQSQNSPPALAETAAVPAQPALPVDLAVENVRLKEELAQRDAAAAQLAEDEKLIASKIELGLTRAQAQAVLDRQRRYDRELLPKRRELIRRMRVAKLQSTTRVLQDLQEQLNRSTLPQADTSLS